MTRRPHDVVDLYLAPVTLSLDANIERLSGLSSEELDVEVALDTNRSPGDLEDRRQAMLEVLTYLVDLHGWSVGWHERGLELAHDQHRLVLGMPANVRAYLQM